MKILYLIPCIAICIQQASAQQEICITTDQTTGIVFPVGIIHADRGTKDVLIQGVKESARILFIKAASRNFHPTNLTVVTEDGNLYSFRVRYDSLPTQLVFTISLPAGSAASYGNYVSQLPRNIKGVKDKAAGMIARVTGIYIQDSTLFYRLEIANKTYIGFDTDQLRFYIRDKRRPKRTTIQELEVLPLHITENTQQIPANATVMAVAAFKKFTIPDEKEFVVEITERNGGRNLLLKLNNRKIIKARPLPVITN